MGCVQKFQVAVESWWETGNTVRQWNGIAGRAAKPYHGTTGVPLRESDPATSCAQRLGIVWFPQATAPFQGNQSRHEKWRAPGRENGRGVTVGCGVSFAESLS